MKRILIFIMMFILSYSAQADVMARKKNLIKIIDEELSEVVRMNNQTRGRNADLLLRMAELYLEKGRILQEIENDRYLKIPAKKRHKINQKKFFKVSRQHFDRAKSSCALFLKRFPNHPRKAEAYYIMAYHARDVEQNTKKATKYFGAASKQSRKGSTANLKSSLALAEMLYNNGNYKKAIPLYESALRKVNDRWWTKDSYNLAWCYYRSGQQKRAAAKMEIVYKRSKNPKYVDMSRQAEKDLAFFYSSTGQTSKAVGFYKKVGGNVAENLIVMALNLRDKGNYNESASLSRKALQNNPTDSQRVRVQMNLLEVYQRQGKRTKHLQACKDMEKLKNRGATSARQSKVLLYHLQKEAAETQKLVVGKTYAHDSKKRKALARLTAEYFAVLGRVDSKRQYEYKLFVAESYFAIGWFNSAIPLYDEALEGATKAGNKKVTNAALTGLTTSLGKPKVKKELKDKYLIKSYMAFLKKNPRSKESFKVYQRLFGIQMDAKKVKEAESTLISFKRYFPKSTSVQAAMVGKIVDHHRKKKDIKALKLWQDKLKRGEFRVNREFRKRLASTITTMRFEGVEKASSRGDKLNALRGYIDLYKAPDSTNYEKKNAAYNIAILFHQLGDAERTFGWAERALNLMPSKDVKKFESSYITFASYLFNKRQFGDAIQINTLALEKLCRTKSKNRKVFFKNAYVMMMAEGRVDEVLGLVKKYGHCGIPKSVINEAKLDSIKELVRNENWEQANGLILDAAKVRSLRPELIAPSYEIYKAYQDASRYSQAKKIKKRLMNYYRSAVKKGERIPLEGLDIIANFKLKSLYSQAQKLKSIKLSFPEKKYNITLKRKLKQLDVVIGKSLELIKVRSGKGIVRAYKYMVEAHENLIADIKNFSPPNKPKQYVSSFKKAMEKQIVAPLVKQTAHYRKEARKQIVRSEILSVDNSWFLLEKPYPVRIEYDYYRAGVIMDRGGRR